MTTEELVRKYIRQNWGVIEKSSGEQCLRFGPCEIAIEIALTIPELTHLNWGEQVFRVIAESEKNAPPEVIENAIEELADEFMAKLWPLLVKREEKNPWRFPPPKPFMSYKQYLENENCHLRTALQRATEKIKRLEGENKG